jgi:hypothetical protein
MDTSPRLMSKLMAAATLLGLDTAINIIQAQRKPLLDHVAKLQASEPTQEQIVADFQVDAARIVQGALRAKNEAQGDAVKRKYIKRSSYWAKPTKKPRTRFSPRKLHKQTLTAESKVVARMADFMLKYGPQPIRLIVRDLVTHNIIEDSGLAAKRVIHGILKANARFARAQKGNWYKLRTGKQKTWT